MTTKFYIFVFPDSYSSNGTVPDPSPLQRSTARLLELQYIKVHINVSTTVAREYLIVRAETTNLVI